MKYFGQYFRYFALQPPKRKPFTNEILRPRLVFASGVRLGLAKSIGGEGLPISERFFAGGSNSLRGFAQNSVGPIGLDLVPNGGNAMLVINNELRAPLFSVFDGVVFSGHRQRLPADQRHLVRSPTVGRRRPARAHAVVPGARRLRRRARPASGRAAQPLLLQHRPGVLM